MSTVKLSVGLP